jgi:hypothetical protein
MKQGRWPLRGLLHAMRFPNRPAVGPPKPFRLRTHFALRPLAAGIGCNDLHMQTEPTIRAIDLSPLTSAALSDVT